MLNYLISTFLIILSYGFDRLNYFQQKFGVLTSPDQATSIDIFLQGKRCKSQCLNGGVCQDGMCYCKSPYVGPACQYQVEFQIGFSHNETYLICFIFFLLGIILVIIIYAFRKMREARQRTLEIQNKKAFEDWEKNKK